MNSVILVIFGITIIFSIHIFLSLRENKYIGLIIPIINLIIAIGIPMALTDFITAFIVYVLLILPLIIEYLIYKYCRNKVDLSKLSKIDKMKINDL
jgi:hypothetical protein